MFLRDVPVTLRQAAANPSNGLTSVGERLPRSNVKFDTKVSIKRADTGSQCLGSIVAEKPSSTVTFQSSFADSTLR